MHNISLDDQADGCKHACMDAYSRTRINEDYFYIIFLLLKFFDFYLSVFLLCLKGISLFSEDQNRRPLHSVILNTF